MAPFPACRARRSVGCQNRLLTHEYRGPFLASEFPERKPGDWKDPLRDGDRTMPVPTATTAHTWIDLWPFYRAGGAPEALVDHSVYSEHHQAPVGHQLRDGGIAGMVACQQAFMPV